MLFEIGLAFPAPICHRRKSHKIPLLSKFNMHAHSNPIQKASKAMRSPEIMYSPETHYEVSETKIWKFLFVYSHIHLRVKPLIHPFFVLIWILSFDCFMFLFVGFGVTLNFFMIKTFVFKLKQSD